MVKLRIRIPGTTTTTHRLIPSDKSQAQVILRGFSGAPSYYAFGAETLGVDEFWNGFAQNPCQKTEQIRKQDYMDLVSQTISEIRSDTLLHKVVLSRSEYCPVEGASPKATFDALEANYSDCTVFALSHPELGDWMGATPEVLLEKMPSGYRSMSLAGTRLKGATEWGSKELEEQQFVTEEIYATLEALGGVVTRSEPYTRSAGPVEHVQTWVHTENKELNIANALETLHPTPAVCGTPTSMARELISKLEQHDRELYTGYIAILGEQPSASVLLRTMKWHRDGVRFFAGGGITKDSVPLDEWNETQYKMAALKDLLS